MKTILTIAGMILICILITVSPAQSYADSSGKSLTILFTHDLHDHMLPTRADINGTVIYKGGYARLKTAIDQQKMQKKNNILIDAGDYSIGELFHSIYTSDAPELRIMGQMGYDVTTFGNHEFDCRDEGLARHLYAAKNSGDKLPQIVSSNISFPEAESMTKSLQYLKNAMSAYGVKEYTVIEQNGIKIGVFGLIGRSAQEYAPMAGVVFNDCIKSAENTVKKLKNKEKADIIVCLSHSGISSNFSESEDEQLAKKVPDIDVIISGHTHTKLKKPILAGDTIIGACGNYSDYLGVIDLIQDSNGRWKPANYELETIDNRLKENPEINATINNFKAIVQRKYLDVFGLKFDEVLAKSTFSFTPAENIVAEHREDPLGNLITDGYIYSVRKAEGDSYEPVDVAIVAAGTMRGSFVKGDITVSDAFASNSLGAGLDGMPGYPLISVYLTGKELRNICELDASISPIINVAQLYMSGLSFTFNPNRMIFNRVTDVHLVKPDGTAEKVNDSKLYRVVTGLYSGQMLSYVNKKSFGILSLVPKSKDGKPITDYEDQIIYYYSNERKNEVKEWFSTAQYLQSFKKLDGIAQVPDYYKTTHNRKIADDNKNIFAIIKNPNDIAVKIYIAGAVLIFAVAFAAVLIVKRIKLKQKRKSLSN
jgi:2',3'-cyclic-nucleotide 2'-phosphodiesterase (5'-nucleotidase family)